MTLGSLQRRPIVVEFTNGEVTWDAGLMPIRQIDQHYGLSQQIAARFTDHRAPSRVEHSMEAQRLYGLVPGYDDLTSIWGPELGLARTSG
jgi:hypothetical protein